MSNDLHEAVPMLFSGSLGSAGLNLPLGKRKWTPLQLNLEMLKKEPKIGKGGVILTLLTLI